MCMSITKNNSFMIEGASAFQESKGFLMINTPFAGLKTGT